MAELLIYRASAGSGKTHVLVTRYIQWALRYPDAFKHILAVTFTNHATQEMKQRILAYLYSLSIGQETVVQEMLRLTGWGRAQLQRRSKEVLARMVYQYGDFSVTTIDSFFYKLIQTFAQSMGLPHQFAIEMDESLALQETIEALSTLDEPLLQKWMVDFALTKLLAGKSWHIKSHIQELGKALFDESFKLHEQALLTAFEQPERWFHFVATTQACWHGFEEKMQQIGQTALNILKQEGLTPADFSYGTKGVIGYFLKLASKKELQPTKRAIQGSDDLTSWYKKKHPSDAIARVVETLLHPLLMEAMTLHAQEGLAYRTAMVRARFTYAFGMIGALLIGLERYRSQNHLLFISDVSVLLYQAIQGSDTPFLYEQVGNQFHHLLIDEFQDLSLFQWMNIKPLVRNGLAQGHSSLVVGDVKQSIYRWRGSNWKLLNHQVAAEFKESTIHGLTTNRRSKEAVVLFNNCFFKRAAGQLVDYLEATLPPMEPLANELAQMRRAYDDVVQQPDLQPGGYVEFFLLRSEQKADDVMVMHTQQAFIALLERLQKEGIPAKDIVVLVRNHREATLLAHTTATYKVVSDYAYVLGSHMAIKVLIHTLYYLHNEYDLINIAAWIETYASCTSSSMGHHDRLYKASDIHKLIPQSFWVQKEFLKNTSVYNCVQLVIACLFHLPHDFGDVLAFFQSIVLNSFLTGTTSIEAFLVWWEKKGRMIKLPISHQDHVIKAMTIHQAKGLAFKVVIIPFCSWGLDHPSQHGPILWSLHYAQPSYFPIWPIGYGAALKETHYAQDYYLEQIQIHLDNLNLLYVAFTRAAAQLYVMAPLPGKMEGMTTVADVIYQSLQPPESLCGTGVPRATDIEETALGTRFCFS